MSEHATEHASDLALDAIRLGKGDPTIAQHVSSCAVCTERSGVLERSATEFAARFDIAGLAADATMRAERARQKKPWAWAWLPALATIALVVVVAPRDGVRTKGASAPVEIYLRSAGAEPVRVEGPVPADAHLAVRVSPPAPRLVRLLWESEPGRWDALYPGSNEAGWAIASSTWLEREVVLDGARAPERLAAVLCTDAITHAEAIEILRGVSRADCTAETLPIVKR